jgi:hypothetical protein
METKSIIRRAVRADIPKIIRLVTPLYDYRRDERFFIWQCFENVRPSILLVAEENRDIVGMYGIQEVQTTNGLSGGQVSWINIAKHKRGCGLFAEMATRAQSHFPDLDFVFIFANRDSVHACKNSLGMTLIGTLTRLILKNPAFEPPIEARIEIIQTDTIFDEATHHDGFVSFRREERYRRWRYAESTEYQYFKLTVATGGYVIIKLFQKANSQEPVVGDIVDFECDLLDPRQLKLLLQAACFQLKRMDAAAVSIWAVPETPLMRVLQELGFSESSHDSYFGINVLHQNYADLYHFNTWHLVQSDATNY